MSNWSGGSTRGWRRTRSLVLLRDAGKGCRAHREGWCARAQAKSHSCADVGQAVHHTLGRSVTGDDPRYLVASCTACNSAIGDPRRAGDPPGKGATKW